LSSLSLAFQRHGFTSHARIAKRVERKEIVMAAKSRRNFLAALAAAPFPGGLVARAPSFDESSRKDLQERYFPNFELTTHEGKKVRFYDDLIKDKVVVINFMYVDCEGKCPVITANLLKVQKLLGDRVGRDIFMYSITLDPKHDDAKALNQYAMMHGVKPGWVFLTGKPDEIDTLRRKLGFSDGNPKLDKDRNNHIGMVRYGNEPRQWWAMCPGKARAGWIVESVLWMVRPLRKRPQSAAGVSNIR
jgi:protein SCO1